jgi:ferrous iron transport protein A
MSEISLDQIEPENNVKVIHIGKGLARRRLLDMGIIPGIEIEVIKQAPLKDPIEIKLRGYNLSLRRREAKDIIVEK